MIQDILPPGVVAEEATRDLPDAPLYPAEAELVKNAVDKRRDEFTTVRACARRALARLGLPPGPVLPDRHGAPRWPDGVIGSMTHCNGYRAVALARTSVVNTLGIDAETNGPLPEGVLESIAIREERDLIKRCSRTEPEIHWDRLLFSMKEAIYKSWYPLTGQRPDFGDAVISFSADSPVFTAALHCPHAPQITRAEGRWAHHDGLLLTVVARRLPVAAQTALTDWRAAALR